MTRLSAEEVRELRRLHAQLGKRADALFSGEYRSAVRGRGMEFEEVRAYAPGDDVRHIDWNVTARSGEPFIKVFREERQNTVLLVADVSGSARVGAGGSDGKTDRRRQIARVAGSLAYAGVRNRDRVGLVTFSDRVEKFLVPRPTRQHVWGVIQEIFAAHAEGRGTDLAGALGFVAKVQRRRAVVVVVSDFFSDGAWEVGLASLARRHEVHALLVHDPLDTGLPMPGIFDAMFDVVDAETGRTAVLSGGWRSEPVEARLARLRRVGVRATAISTSEDPFVRLHRHFQRVGGGGA